MPKKKYQERSLIEFQKAFPDNEAFAKHLARQRWPNGFNCPQCGDGEAWYLPKRALFDCKICRYQTSVTAGTIFHRTHTPLVKWYWLLYHMAMDKVGVSIAEMQRVLDIKQYRTAWLMAHKIRKAMADRDAGYSLAGLVEIDESFFGPKGTKRGRGSERKCTVLCAVSLYRDRQGEEHPGFAHMRVVDNASAGTIENFLERLGCGATTKEGQALMEAIRTDGWRSYGKAAGKLLTWVHRVISNAKTVIRGAPRGVSEKHLQAHLSEICYRFNRRFWEKELFARLVQACIPTETITHNELVGGEYSTQNL